MTEPEEDEKTYPDSPLKEFIYLLLSFIALIFIGFLGALFL